MRSLVVILAIFLSFGLNTSAQTIVNLNQDGPAQIIESPKGGGGVMTFEKEMHNFDTIEYAGNGTYEFKFKNTGTEPIIITDAQASCGCTVPTYPKNTPVKPGETQVIKVTYNTTRTGAFNKTITVFSNASEPIKTISIKGFVRAKAPEPPVFPVDAKPNTGLVPFER